MDYVIWTTDQIPFQAKLNFLFGFDDFYKTNMSSGCSFEDLESVEGKMLMDPDAPEDKVLTDNLKTTFLMTVVSEKLKNRIEELSLPNVEFQKTEILDHKERPIQDNYYVLNVKLLVDAIDQDASTLKWNNIVKKIKRIKSLVLAENAIPENTPWFRPAHFGKLIFVRRDIAEKLSSNGISGLCWTEVSDYVS